MKIKIVLLLSLIISQLSSADEHNNMAHAVHDMPSTHGMFLFGTQKVYLSHLPMFHTPHDYQVLLEVEIPESVKQKYLSLVEENPSNTIFTIVPESFVLPDLVQNKKSFMAKIFIGHFERGGKAVTSMVKFNIKEVIFFKKFDPQLIHPKESQYILIGNTKEQFLIHDIYTKPDFDQILHVKVENQTLLDELSKTNYISLEFKDLSNIEPIMNQKTVSYKGSLIKIIQSLYLEFGDLSF